MSETRASMAKVLLFLVFLGLGCSNSPSPDKQASKVPQTAQANDAKLAATWKYWQGMLSTTRKMSEYSKDPKLQAVFKAEPKGRDQVLAHCKRGSELFEEGNQRLAVAIEQIESLPVLNVDSEALDIGTKAIDVIRAARVSIGETVSFLKDSAHLVEDGTSWLTLFEVVLVGNKRLTQEQEKLKARWDALSQRLQTVARDNDRVSAEIRRVRIVLTQRYSKEFPALD